MDITLLKKINLVKDMERDNDIVMGSFYVGGLDQKYFAKMGVPFGVQTQITLSNREIFYDQQELDAAKKFLLQKGKTLPLFAKELTQKFMALARDYDKFLKRNKNVNFQHLSSKEVERIYVEYLEHIYNLIPYSFIVSNILESASRKVITAALQQQYTDAERVYAQLIVPKKLNKTAEEYRSRLELATFYKKKKSSFLEKINVHLNQFGWLSCFRPMDEPLAKEDLLREVKQLAANNDPSRSLELLEEQHKQALVTADKLEKGLSCEPHIKLLIRIMRENAWVRTYRRELMSIGFRQLQPMYQAIAKLLGYSLTDLKYVACWEITELLQEKKKISLEEIGLRKQLFAVVRLSGEKEVLSGKKAQNLIVLQENISLGEIFKGQAVSPGKAQGIVSVINGKDDLKNFQRGNILVTYEVMIWMTPIIEMSAAIIAESGRALSHTGIVAREFRKPCVVGIKNATKIFRSGTEVEINADLGMVKILK